MKSRLDGTVTSVIVSQVNASALHRDRQVRNNITADLHRLRDRMEN